MTTNTTRLSRMDAAKLAADLRAFANLLDFAVAESRQLKHGGKFTLHFLGVPDLRDGWYEVAE